MYRLHAIILCLALAVAAGFAQAPLKAPRSEAGEGWCIAGFSADSLRRALGARPVHELEGLWTDPADGAVVAVMGSAAPGAAGTAGNALLIVAVDTPMVGVGCGTVVGWMNPTARQDYYEARMFTRLDSGRLSRPKTFDIRHADGRLMLTRRRKGLRVVLTGLLPFMFRRPLRQTDNTPRELSGYVRLWPSDPDHPVAVRYL